MLREGAEGAGPDSIPPEVVKNSGLDVIILQFCNLVLLSKKQICALFNIINGNILWLLLL